MLTPAQISQANATARTPNGNVPPTTQMTPEQARAWIGGTSQQPQQPAQRPAIADAAIGAGKTASSFIESADSLGTLNRLQKGDTSDLNANKIPQMINSVNSLGTMHHLAGDAPSPFAGDGISVPKSETPDWSGTSPAQREQNNQPTNYAQKVGQSAAIVAANVAPFAKEAMPSIKEAAGTLKESLTPKPPTPEEVSKTNLANKAKNDEFISSQYTKAIKPTIVGKTNPGQLERYNANVGKAISTIVESKPHLTLTDQFGDATGKLPQTIDEFRQAIDQSKAAIFKQYDAMAKTAGEAGATVDLTPAARELQKVANNKVVQDLHPDLASYATSRAESLTKRGTYTTEEAQAATQNLNKSLEAYYRNPSYETASRAGVDAMIANQLRSGLDASIESAGQAGYSDLKGKYAALKAIEKDVTKRGIVEARQTGGRGLSVGDIVSAEELIRGLATMNPTALAAGATIKGIQALRKWYTDPNRAIKQMFEKAESTTPPPSNQATPSPTVETSPSPDSTTQSPKVQGGIPDMQETNAPIGKEGVSAQKADTSGPFEQTLYHGSPNKFAAADIKATKGTQGTGIYLDLNKDTATKYAKGGQVIEFQGQDLKLAESTKFTKAQSEKFGTEYEKAVAQLGEHSDEATNRAYKAMGFDGKKITDTEVMLFDSSKLKSSPSIPKEGAPKKKQK